MSRELGPKIESIAISWDPVTLVTELSFQDAATRTFIYIQIVHK